MFSCRGPPRPGRERRGEGGEVPASEGPLGGLGDAGLRIERQANRARGHVTHWVVPPVSEEPPTAACVAGDGLDYFADAAALGLSTAFLNLVDSGPAHPAGFSSFVALGGGLGTVGGCPTCPRPDDGGAPGVPEPATLLLLGAGRLGLACRRHLRKLF